MNVEKAFARIDDAEIIGLPAANVSEVAIVAPVPPYARPIEEAAILLGRSAPAHLWKYLDADGNLLFAVARWDDAAGEKVRLLPISWVRGPDGAEAFAFKHQIAPRPLYGLSDLRMRPDAPILVVEGEKCADAAKAVFSDCVVVTSSNGAASASQSDWTSLAGRNRVWIWPDLDAPGAKYAVDVAEILLGLGIPEILIVDAQRVAEGDLAYRERKQIEGWDVGDAVDEGHAFEKIRDAAIAAGQLYIPDGSSFEEQAGSARTAIGLPSGYNLSARGLTWSDPADDDKLPITIASKFSVVAETRDHDGTSWGVLLHWNDHDGRHHQHALPRASLAGDGADARRILLDGGLYVAPGRKARDLLNSFLLQVRSPVRARATQRVGWHANSFVLPDQSFGEQKNDMLLLQTTTAHEHAFRQNGILEDWQENVARYAIGNSRIVLAISAAFAGPLVGPCSAEGGGIHLKGASSTGKSTALHVAGSVWGGGDANGYVRSWRATANGLEGVALGHSDTLLCLDELSQLAAKDAGEAAYMLANGSGKSRSSRDGSARRASKWQVLFLSSGEIGLADKVAEDGRGRKLAAGQHVRIVDVPADAGRGMGMFEELHGFASPEIFARKLKAAAQQYYGVAAREYLSILIPDLDAIRTAVAQHMASFISKYVPAGADGQVERVAQRFALIAAGGEIAAAAGIVPWDKGVATGAAARCFADWLTMRGGIEPAEVQQGIEQVRAFLQAHGMARFIPAWEEHESEKIVTWRDVAGYRRKTDHGWDFYVTTTAWKEQVCRGLDARRVAATLGEKGLIQRSGKDSRWANVVAVPGHGKMRLYHLLAALLEDRDA
jgi:putative DNA primase/helicase